MVRIVPAGTWDAHWLVFYPTAIWTRPIFFVNTAAHDLHPPQKVSALCSFTLSRRWSHTDEMSVEDMALS